MTPEERTARVIDTHWPGARGPVWLEKTIAETIRAAEREAYSRAIEDAVVCAECAVEAERERCAKIVEARWSEGVGDLILLLADEIRGKCVHETDVTF